MSGHVILECQDCGAGFSAQVPEAERLSALYEQLYRSGGAYESHRRETRLIQLSLRSGHRIPVGWERRTFFRIFRPRPGDRLLDIGCGTGLFMAAAAQRGWTACGVELSNEAALLGQAVHGLCVHHGALGDAPRGWHDFAAITAWEVLEHIPAPADFLAELRNRLRPKGVFAGSVPNYARRRYRYGTDLGPVSVPPVHLNYWTPAALRSTLRRAGFRHVYVGSPRVSIDVLKPRPSVRRLARFVKLALGRDVLTSMFFAAA
jgi:2-polyprenyl-3-methyl-5-hydroxy-6-metoxy-1,4-benzoquinol methylase